MARERALRGRPVSQSSTRRRHRPSSSAALRPAGPPPAMTTSNTKLGRARTATSGMVISVNVSDFDFDLPDELIAQEPPPERGASRLLVLQRSTGEVEHATFTDLARFLRPGDVLVLNDTRVFPARLLGHRVPSGGNVECLLVRRLPTPSSQLPTTNNEPPTG